MDWLFNQLVSWLSDLLATVFDAISKLFEKSLGCNLTQFDSIFPFAKTAEDIMLGLGLTLLFLIMLFQLFRSLWGPLADKSVEHPVSVVIRSCVFFPIVFFSKSIVIYILALANVPYMMLVNTSASAAANGAAGSAGWAASINSSITSTLTSVGITVAAGAVWPLIIGLVFIVLIGWNYIKLIIEVAERYVILGLIAYTAPLATSAGGSKATSNIFGSWCRFMASQVLLMIMNVWCLAVIDSGMYSLGHHDGDTSFNIVIWALCIIAFEKAAQSLDNYMKSIIGNGAITGNGILDDLVATFGTLKEGGKALGSFLGGSSSGGGGRSGGGGSSVPPSEAAGNAFQGRTAHTAGDYAKAAWKSGGLGVAAMAASDGMRAAGHAVHAAAANMELQDCLKMGRTSSSLNAAISKAAHGAGINYGGYINDTAKSAYASDAANYYVGGGQSSFKDTTIGDGEINTHTTDSAGNDMNVKYSAASHFRAPEAGSYENVTAKDGSKWYKQQWQAGEQAPKAPERIGRKG